MRCILLCVRLPVINFVSCLINSFQVGNPYLDRYKNQKGRFEYLWNHGVLSDEDMANITRHCSFTPSDDKLCSDLYGWYDFGPIDPYDIYAPVCVDEPDGSYNSSSYVRKRTLLINFFIKQPN
jgi:hypothetical protein